MTTLRVLLQRWSVLLTLEQESGTGKMNLRVYRGLYWANQGLIYAARAIEDLSREQGLPRIKLQEFQALIEETRASMNSLLGETIDQHETDRASRLEIVRSSREKATATNEKKTT